MADGTHVGTVNPGLAEAVGADVERAYVEFRRDVYRYLLALTRSHPDAEELTSEVFERALRSWRPGSQPVQRWLLVTARHLATDRWRRARRFLAVLPRLRVEQPSTSAQDRAEFWGWFDSVSRALTSRQREVLILRYQRDLTDEDISAVLGISESGVRSLVARAIEVLRANEELLK